MVARETRAVRALLDRHAAAFMAGDLHALAEAYSLPCPARDAEGREIVLMTEADVIRPLALLREACLARGLAGASARILSIEAARAGRFRAWIRWRHHYPWGTEEPPLDVLYTFALYFGSRLGIERAEYVPRDDRADTPRRAG